MLKPMGWGIPINLMSEKVMSDFHSYLYGENNPLKWIDPLGLWRSREKYPHKNEPEPPVNLNALSPHMKKIEKIVDEVFRKYSNNKYNEAVVTYGIEGEHGKNSLHYEGNAVDLRTWGLSMAEINQIVNELRRRLGEDYDVIYESKKEPHIHIEYDPKGCKK
jgi:multidrug efflux pump subunit AcrB